MSDYSPGRGGPYSRRLARRDETRARITKIHRDRFRVRAFLAFPEEAPPSRWCENRHPPACYFVKHERSKIIGITGPRAARSRPKLHSYCILYPTIIECDTGSFARPRSSRPLRYRFCNPAIPSIYYLLTGWFMIMSTAQLSSTLARLRFCETPLLECPQSIVDAL